MNADKILNAADAVRAAIFPDRCPLCDIPVAHNSGVCKNCRKTAPIISGRICLSCGLPEKECKCKKKSNFYEAVTAPFKYKDVVRKGIATWKFRDGVINTEFFAKLIAACVRKNFADAEIDFICFVPQTDDESWEREYNQSELLAEQVGELLKIPVKPVLKKLFETNRQHELPKHLRSGNVFGVFDCVDGETVKNKNILIIDDIKTSGNTLNECAKILRLYDAVKVYCAVIAIA